MAPWGYCITVDLVSESDDETVYVCHREGCNETFRFPRAHQKNRCEPSSIRI